MLCQAEILHATLMYIVAQEERRAAENADLASNHTDSSSSVLRYRTHDWMKAQSTAEQQRFADLQVVKQLL